MGYRKGGFHTVSKKANIGLHQFEKSLTQFHLAVEMVRLIVKRI